MSHTDSEQCSVMDGDGRDDSAAGSDPALSSLPENSALDSPRGGTGSRSVSDLVRDMDSAATATAAAAATTAPGTKRGRWESGSPAQHATKVRDNGDGSNFETILETALTKLRRQIQGDFDEFQESMRHQFTVMGQRLKKVEEKLEEKEKELAKVTTEAQNDRRELRELQTQVEENERVSRLPSLILSGSAVPKKPPPNQLPQTGENVEELAMDLLREHFRGLDVKPRDIDRAHRLPGRGDPRIICMFVQSGAGSVRDIVYKNRLDLRGRNFYVGECLTKKRADVLRCLTDAKKVGKLYTAFSRQGHVFYKLQKNGENMRIDSMSEARERFAAAAV